MKCAPMFTGSNEWKSNPLRVVYKKKGSFFTEFLTCSQVIGIKSTSQIWMCHLMFIKKGIPVKYHIDFRYSLNCAMCLSYYCKLSRFEYYLNTTTIEQSAEEINIRLILNKQILNIDAKTFRLECTQKTCALRRIYFPISGVIFTFYIFEVLVAHTFAYQSIDRISTFQLQHWKDENANSIVYVTYSNSTIYYMHIQKWLKTK